MQIQRIQRSPNFGYNEQLNAKLIKQLTIHRKNKPFCETLLKLNELTNATEKLVREAEENNRTKLLDKIASVFIDMKGTLCAALDFSFPKLHYCEYEAATFADEIEKRGLKDDENHWLNALLNEIQTNSTKIITLNDLPEEIQANILTKMEENSEKITKGKSLVKIYTPTENMKNGFASLGGMQELKEKLNDRIVGMLKDPEQAKLDFEEYGKKSPKGILMYGPPGCGKTTITQALSVEAGVPLLQVEVGKIGSPYIHEMSMNIDAIFDYAESITSKNKPTILFIDDADALFGERSGNSGSHHQEELSTFLNRVQRAGENNIVVIAATNRKDIMDEAIVSRFEEQIEVPLPDKEARKSVIKMFMESRKKGLSLANDKDALSEIAEKTDRFSIRTLKNLAELASMKALKDGRRDIKKEDWFQVINENQHQKTNPDIYREKGGRTPIGFFKTLEKKD